MPFFSISYVLYKPARCKFQTIPQKRRLAETSETADETFDFVAVSAKPAAAETTAANAPM